MTQMFLKLEDPKLKKLGPELLGGKGFGLSTMAADGLPVPPALIFPTSVCSSYQADPSWVMERVREELPEIKEYFVSKFGFMPLLSVRSGARVSMPGMMDTVLNVGLDNSTFPLWEEKLGYDCAYDSACRLIEMYGSVVNGIARESFEGLDAEARSALYTKHTGSEFPDADAQILGAIEAVFNSWNNDRAKVYRKMNNIPEEWGTAVVLQAMVFGNLNDNSATGVLFTRNPDSGERVILGEYLVNAQGEDVVAGTRTPNPLDDMKKATPEVYEELIATVLNLEKARKDMQDVEFTIQDGKLYILQTRNAKRSAKAAVRIAMEMVEEGTLTKEEALKRVTARQFDVAQQSVIDPEFKTEPDFTGIPACSGVVKGVVVKTAAAAINCKEPCILVTQETTPDDIAGMAAAIGVLTMTGGATSHAAVVARSMDRPCVVGLGKSLGDFNAGDTITIDGASGKVWRSEVPVISGADNPHVKTLRETLWGLSKCYEHSHHPSAYMLRMPELVYIPREEALKIVREHLAQKAQLTVDLTESEKPEDKDFFQPFRKPCETDNAKELLAYLENGLKAAEKKRLKVLTSLQTKLPRMGCADSLEQLVLHDEGPLLFTGKNTEAVAKVMEWKLQSGVTLAQIGVVTEGGYVTEAQLIEEYLA